MSVQQLWDALGLKPTEQDVTELAAERIKQLFRLFREQYSRGHLLKVQLFPCPKCGTRWAVDEWYTSKQPGIPNKVHAATEVRSIEEAEALYRSVFVTLKPSYYDRASDTYTDYCEDCNFIVTGSHALCSQCRRSTP